MAELTTMEKYESSKDSGVSWLGKIPSEWNLTPGFKAYSENKRDNKGMKEDQVLSLSYGKIVVKPKEKLVGLVPESFETYQIVEPGDLIIRCMDLQNDKTSLRTGLSENHGIITSAYLNLKINARYDSKFLYYYLHSLDTTKVLYKFGTGLRQNLSFQDFYRLPVFDIPKSLQTSIASFLDKKTTHLDEAIAIKEKQIDLLKERKQIIIQKAVTQGLNSDVPKKASGVDWVPEVPEHWVVKPLTKYSTRVDYRGKTPEKVESGRFLLTTKNIKNGAIDYEISQEFIKESQYESIMSRGKPKIGDLLFTMEAPLGASAVVDNPNVAIAQRIIKFALDKTVFDPNFLNCVIQTTIFQRHLNRLGTGSTAIGIKASKLGLLKFPVPDVAEQKEIFNVIKKESLLIDKAINVQKEQIDKLKEYKATLINSAVTGKIKVPEVA